MPNVPAAADRRPIELLLADDDLAHTHDDLAHTNDHVWRRREWRHDDEYGRAYFHGGGGIVIGADHRNDDPGLHVRLAVNRDSLGLPPMSDQPPCVICARPGVMGVGVVGEAPEAWYCAAHLADGQEHGARPVPGWRGRRHDGWMAGHGVTD